MAYIIIGLIVYAVTVTLLLVFFAGSQRNEELEALFRYYDYCESYLETQYGVDDYVRGKKNEDN